MPSKQIHLQIQKAAGQVLYPTLRLYQRYIDPLSALSSRAFQDP